MKNTRQLSILLVLTLFAFPLILFGQHEVEATHGDIHEGGMVFEILEWIEYIVDLVGLGIIILGFLKGFYVFIRMEIDNFTNRETFDDILALRSTLGGYIILALDFLIISDIIHSVIKPEFNELINLGIIVVLRTSIGFFLGRELMELRHGKKEQTELEEFIEEHESKSEHKH